MSHLLQRLRTLLLPAPLRDPRHRMGRRAEWVARWWLRTRRYRILASRYQTPFAEIDLVAVNGPDLVIVEVKSRQGDGEFTIHPEQRARLARAALWLDARFGRRATGVRVDLVRVGWSSYGYPSSIELEQAVIGEEELVRQPPGH